MASVAGVASMASVAGVASMASVASVASVAGELVGQWSVSWLVINETKN